MEITGWRELAGSFWFCDLPFETIELHNRVNRTFLAAAGCGRKEPLITFGSPKSISQGVSLEEAPGNALTNAFSVLGRPSPPGS